MLQLSREELQNRRSQFLTSKLESKMAYAFTELGVAMLSSVLNSERAVRINIRADYRLLTIR